jgi:hypothetical protein
MPPKVVRIRTRAPSAYNIFMSTALREVRSRNPGMHQRDVMRQAAALWMSKKGSGLTLIRR